MMIRPVISCLLLSSLCVPATVAQGFEGWETEFDGAMTLVTVVNGDDASEDALGEISLGVRSTRVLENGAEIGLRLALRGQRDHPARPAGAGVFLDGTDGDAGGLTGIIAGADGFDTGPRASIELAYAYIDGGYGELTLGRDTGMAQRFAEGGDSVFRLARVDGAALDPSGRSIVRTADAVSGSSFKVSYASPRFLGLRAGVSLTPDAAENEGLDRNPALRTADGTAIVPGQGVELGLNGSRVIGRDGPRLDVGLTWSRYDAAASGPAAMTVAVEDVETWSAGIRGEFGKTVLGVAWLSSSDGAVGQTYEALSSSATYALSDNWQIGAEWGRAEFERGGVEGESWGLGARRQIGDILAISAGWREDALSSPRLTAGDFSGIVMEITLRP